MEERGLGVLELDGDVACETEVRVLVDRARDEARDVGCSAKDVREGVGEGGRGLDGGKVDLADVVTDKGSYWPWMCSKESRRLTSR